MISPNNKILEDFEILKKVVNKELSMNDIDSDTKARLIDLCDSRITDINRKIEEYDEKIKSIKICNN